MVEVGAPHHVQGFSIRLAGVFPAEVKQAGGWIYLSVARRKLSNKNSLSVKLNEDLPSGAKAEGVTCGPTLQGRHEAFRSAWMVSYSGQFQSFSFR